MKIYPQKLLERETKTVTKIAVKGREKLLLFYQGGAMRKEESIQNKPVNLEATLTKQKLERITSSICQAT